ncbi:hypothetical protein QUF90_21285 [Desulfococcaceae bacterium HSG9]|nr:hypothetical protein [Desulfococcaceae bacterium HSG9]
MEHQAQTEIDKAGVPAGGKQDPNGMEIHPKAANSEYKIKLENEKRRNGKVDGEFEGY